METTYKEIQSPDERGSICNDVLRSLPDWFGIEEAIVDYVNQSRGLPVFAAFDGGLPVGFVALKQHNAYTAEVCVMGILQRYHRHGIGRELIRWCEESCRSRNMRFLTVKTLDETGNSAEYDRTRAFYLAMGFMPLEVFKTLWDERNPCLFLAKCVR